MNQPPQSELRLLAQLVETMESIDRRLSVINPHPNEIEQAVDLFIESAIGCGVQPFA